MTEAIVEQIYEAAFLPEKWSATLETIVAATASSSSAIVVYPDSQTARGCATEVSREGFERYLASGEWRHSRRPIVARQAVAGFLCANDYLSPADIERDPNEQALRALGLGWQVNTTVPMGREEMVVFTFERWLSDGRHSPGEMAFLNSLRPHLARAGLMASRLRLERAEAAVSTLQAVGLPGAVLTASGKVVASNDRFDMLQPDIVAAAGGAIAIRSPKADALYRDALDRLAAGAQTLAQSIPIASSEDKPPAVLHLLPIRRAARDVFDGAATLLVATLVGERSLPDLAVLVSLFDLTPAEARLAADLTAGSTINDYASASGSSIATARTHLGKVFAKTGTDRQADLVALLSSVKRY